MSRMLNQGLRLLLFFAGIFAAAGGCAGVPTPPSQTATSPPAPGTDSRVVPASATEPIASSPADSTAAGKPAEDDQGDDGFELSDLAPENLWKNAKEAAGLGPNEEAARTSLEEGKALYQEKKYSGAADKFKAAAKRWPESVLEEDAQFLLAESYFFADRYPDAQDGYDNLLTKYDNSRYLDTAVKRLFGIGQYWEKLEQANPHWPVTPNFIDKERPWFDTFGNALKCYETVRLKDPTGPLADDSVMATANAYFRHGRFEDAAFHYDTLRTEYPNSEHQAKAHLLGLQAKLEVYQGASYDRTPLDEADKIAKQALTQFPAELGGDRQRVAETRDKIIEQQAERDWTMAQYYDNKKQFGAARFYYGELIREYPLSQTARKARQRLEAIRDRPDNPPSRVKWLTDLFPEDD